MKIIIIGGGKVGYYLVKTLVEHGHEPTIVEMDKKTSSSIANDLDIPVICGDGTSIDVLEEAGIAQTDALLAVSGRDENNLVACQLVKRIYPNVRTVVRVNNPKNVKVMKMLGIDNVISSTDRIAEMVEREVDTSKIKELISLSHGIGSISEISLPESYKLNGIALMDFKVPDNINIVSIQRGDDLIIPRGNTQLLSGDTLLVIAKNISSTKIQSIFKIN